MFHTKARTVNIVIDKGLIGAGLNYTKGQNINRIQTGQGC